MTYFDFLETIVFPQIKFDFLDRIKRGPAQRLIENYNGSFIEVLLAGDGRLAGRHRPLQAGGDGGGADP